MEQVRKLEKSLGGLYKDAPALPKNVKEALANVWPWVALVLGILQLAAAWSLWRLYDNAQNAADVVNQFTQYYGVQNVGYSSFDSFVIFLAIALLTVQAVIMIMAFSPLKARLNRGWELMFLSALISLVYSVATIFIDGRGFGSFIFSLLFAAIGLYFLFQLRDVYGSKPAPSKPAKS